MTEDEKLHRDFYSKHFPGKFVVTVLCELKTFPETEFRILENTRSKQATIVILETALKKLKQE